MRRIDKKTFILYFIITKEKSTKVVRRRENVITDYKKETRTLTLRVTEEIDQHTADRIRRKLDSEIEIYSPRKVVFDFHHVTFMYKIYKFGYFLILARVV